MSPRNALRNFGTWWMDLGASGWFNDPGMWEEMKRLAHVGRCDAGDAHAVPPRGRRRAIDSAACCTWRPAAVSVTVPGIYEVRRALGPDGQPLRAVPAG